MDMGADGKGNTSAVCVDVIRGHRVLKVVLQFFLYSKFFTKINKSATKKLVEDEDESEL